MKITFLIILALIVLFFVSQAFVSSGTKGIEMHKYTVLKKYENFEIRKYEPSNFSYTTMNSTSYKESSGQGFRTLAGYIFGKNDREQKISMTSPVKMEMGDSITMMFMIPSDLELNTLPTPTNPNVKFKSEPAKVVAAITFSGWADDEKIQFYRTRLIDLLNKEGIEYEQEFSFLGYNPPFEFINRRNEIIVTLKSEGEPK